MIKFQIPFLLVLITVSILGQPFVRLHGELCDWRSPTDTCDQSRGLACSYKTHTCGCWNVQTIYSREKDRCVGISGGECHFFGGERLCTENAYCLEDQSLSPVPICVCLKGYFKGQNGNCIRKSKFGEFCDSGKYPRAVQLQLQHNNGLGHSCEPESGLHCVNYRCQCEANQIYDTNRELCISLTGKHLQDKPCSKNSNNYIFNFFSPKGMSCSKSLNNCVENADCSEKVWSLDHISGETKISGYRCACRAGLKVTTDGYCAVEYGGMCRTTFECNSKEHLHCINGKCQCHPLSQVYDRQAKKCLNLVGARCHMQPHQKQDRSDYQAYQQQNEQVEQARIIQSTSSTSLPPPPAKVVSEKTSHVTTTSSTTTTSAPPKKISSASPKSRNLTGRSFHFESTHLISPRHFLQNGNVPEHRDVLSLSTFDRKNCVSNAECTPSFSSDDYYCTCKNGSTETVMRTCLLNYDEPCGQNGDGLTTLECNIFEGLTCDNGICKCADPILIYDKETQACVSTVGNPCGRMKLNSVLLLNSFDHNDKEGDHQLDSTPPFFTFDVEQQFVTISCAGNATCVDKSVQGQFKQVCVSRGKFIPNKFGFVA